MARIGPVTGLNGPSTGPTTTDDQDNKADEKRDKNDDGPTTTSAASGTLRALSHSEAGATGLQNDTLDDPGSSIDAIVDPQTGDTAVASDSQSGGKRGTVNIKTPEGGVTGQTDESGQITSVSGMTSRLSSLGGGDDSSDPPSNDGSPDGGNPNGGNDGAEDVVTVLRRAAGGQRGAGLPPMLGGVGGPGQPSSGGGGGFMDTLTSPVGLLLAAVFALVVGFGGSEVMDDG